MKVLKVFTIVAALFAFVACAKERVAESKKCSHIWEEGYCSVCGASQLVVNPWRMKSFCGVDAEVDIYIQFNADNTFRMMQRSGSAGYTEYSGTYSADKEQSILSGVYSDGVSWATDYRFSFNEENNLVLESMAESAEVSVYVASEMPVTVAYTKSCDAAVEIVRPL